MTRSMSRVALPSTGAFINGTYAGSSADQARPTDPFSGTPYWLALSSQASGGGFANAVPTDFGLLFPGRTRSELGLHRLRWPILRGLLQR